MSAFGRLSLGTKALVAPTLFLLAAIATIVFAIRTYEQSVEAQRRDLIEAIDSSVLSMLGHFVAAEKSGAMTHGDAMDAARDAISRIRYGKDGFVVVFSGDGHMLVNPNKSFINRSGNELPDG